MDDYRALCAELAEEVEHLWSIVRDDNNEPHSLATRARALLAQPETVVPTVMDIIELHTWLEDEWRANNDGEDLPMLDYARAVLARWGTPANTINQEDYE